MCGKNVFRFQTPFVSEDQPQNSLDFRHLDKRQLHFVFDTGTVLDHLKSGLVRIIDPVAVFA